MNLAIGTDSVFYRCTDHYLVDSAQRDPTETAYFAGSQPMYSKATGNGL